MRMLALNTPCSSPYSALTRRKSANFSNCRTLVKKLASRSTSATVKPIVCTRCTSADGRSWAQARPPADAKRPTVAAAKKARLSCAAAIAIPPRARNAINRIPRPEHQLFNRRSPLLRYHDIQFQYRDFYELDRSNDQTTYVLLLLASRVVRVQLRHP